MAISDWALWRYVEPRALFFGLCIFIGGAVLGTPGTVIGAINGAFLLVIFQ